MLDVLRGLQVMVYAIHNKVRGTQPSLERLYQLKGRQIQDKSKHYFHFCMCTAIIWNRLVEEEGRNWGKRRLRTEEKEKGTARRYLLKMNRANWGQQERGSRQGAAAGR